MYWPYFNISSHFVICLGCFEKNIFMIILCLQSVATEKVPALVFCEKNLKEWNAIRRSQGPEENYCKFEGFLLLLIMLTNAILLEFLSFCTSCIGYLSKTAADTNSLKMSLLVISAQSSSNAIVITHKAWQNRQDKSTK